MLVVSHYHGVAAAVAHFGGSDSWVMVEECGWVSFHINSDGSATKFEEELEQRGEAWSINIRRGC